MSSIREKVARAISGAEFMDCYSHHDWRGHEEEATAAIKAFLEAAAEQGWQLVPEDLTEEMIAAAEELTGQKLGHVAMNMEWHIKLAAAPKFEVGE